MTRMNTASNNLLNGLARLRKDVRRALKLLERQADPERSKTISEFCEAEQISRTEFYELKKQNRAPRLMEIGPQLPRITPEAHRDWRREREAEAAAGRSVAETKAGDREAPHQFRCLEIRKVHDDE